MSFTEHAPTFPTQVDSIAGSGTTLASNSITPVANTLYLVAVANLHASVGTPTLTGTNGFNVTWTQVNTEPNGTNVQRLTVFRGVTSSTTAGVLTADFGGVSQTESAMIVLKYPYVDQTTNQGVVQSVVATQAASSAPTVTLSAYAAPDNIATMFSMTSLNTTWTNSSAGWTPTPVIVGSTVVSLASIFRAHATLIVNPVGTFGASGITCSIGVEVTRGSRFTNNAIDPPGAMAVCGPSFIRTIVCCDVMNPLQAGYGTSGYIPNDPSGTAAMQSPGVTSNTSIGYWDFKEQRDNTVGSPIPSQIQARNGILKGLLVPVSAGSRTLSIGMKADVDTGANYRPQMIIRANPSIGIFNDIIVTATSGTNWQSLSSTFTVLYDGVVEVWRYKRGPDHVKIWWDNAELS